MQTRIVIATFQALAVLLTSVLPGALFTFEFEREYTRLAISDFNERLLVFLTVSALFGIFSAPLLYQGYGQVQMRGVTRSPRDSSGGYAVSAGATSSAGSVAVSAGLSPRAWERTSRPR